MSKYKVEIEIASNPSCTYPISILDGKIGKPVRHNRHSRHVYFHGSLVVKIDQEHFMHQPAEESQCYRENIFWRSVRDRSHAKFFAPVLQYGIANGYRYLVQPKIKFDTKINPEPYQDLLNRLINRFGLTDICPCGNDGGDNWAVSNGNPIIYDYGYSMPDKPHWPEFKSQEVLKAI